MEIRVQQWSYPDLSTLEIGKKHIQFHYTHYAHICQIEYIRAAAKSPHYIKRYKRAKSDKIIAIFLKTLTLRQIVIQRCSIRQHSLSKNSSLTAERSFKVVGLPHPKRSSMNTSRQYCHKKLTPPYQKRYGGVVISAVISLSLFLKNVYMTI